MYFNEKIVGSNIYLKPLNLNDASSEYLSWLNDKKINKFLEVRFDPPKKIKDLKTFIEFHKNSKSSLLFGIFHNNNFIGTIKLSDINENHKFAYVGIMIGNLNYHGLGYGKEAIVLVSDFAINNLKLETLYAGCYDANQSSFNTFLKSGFIKVAEIKDYWILDNKYISNITLQKKLKNNA